MPSRLPFSPLAAVPLWTIALVLCLVWSVLTILAGSTSGWAVVASIGGSALTLGLTWLLSQSVRRVQGEQRRLEEESRVLHQQLTKLLVLLAGTDAAGAKTAGDSRAADPGGSALDLDQLTALSEHAHRLLRQLKNGQAQLTAVFESLDSGVIVIDRQGRVSLANRAAKRFFSVSSQPVGQPLIKSIRQPELLGAARQVRADGSPREVVTELRDQAGVRRVLRTLCVAVRCEEGTSVLLAVRDESEIRLVEEMRREFVANVSHELKTPLAAIKGYAETVELAIADDREAALHFLAQIREQCRRLERLVADMMTLARAQAGAQYLRPTTIDLDAVIAESIATYAPVAGAKAIHLEHHRGETPATLVYADREATLTIANNVIGNAIRYTPEGGRVIAGARREGAFGILAVNDNGIGIPEHEQKRVFQRFYRADKSRQQSSSGTGLGLAIVKNLTQAQGGKVQLQSQPNRGSTFEIYLPATAPAEPV